MGRIGFTLQPVTTEKLDKVYVTMAFKTLGVRQQKTVIPGGWETNEVNLTIAAAYA